MSEFSILFIIFGTLVLLTGLYMFSSHELGIITGRISFKNLNKDDWKKIGKWTIISSFIIYLIAIFLLIINI